MTCSSAVRSAYTSTLSWLGLGVTVRLACLQMIFANGSISRTILFEVLGLERQPL